MIMSNHDKPTAPHRDAFTLVELLVTISIIGIVMAIAIPAITSALRRARQTAQKLEVDVLARSVEQYLEKYGDYPPDGSNVDYLKRHMRRLFPRMASPDTILLDRLTDDSTDETMGTFSGVAMDRAEALVFFLGGFSGNKQLPITGAGGPLEFKPVGSSTDVLDIRNYQYNATRDNALFEFDPARLSIARATDTAPMLSTDEALLGNTAAIYGGTDLLPVYFATTKSAAPIVYFDSRTYGVLGFDTASSRNIYNGYRTGDLSFGGIRPYKTEIAVEAPIAVNYASEAESFNAIKFHKADKFQIISPGEDGVFGAIVSTDVTDPGTTPVHFVTQTGRPVVPYFGTAYTNLVSLVFTNSSLGSKNYQDSDWSTDILVDGHLDNITNFSTSTLESDLE